MVEFNGLRIGDVARVEILDIKISAAPPVVATRNAPYDGQLFVRKTYGPRTVTVMFTLMETKTNGRVWFGERINEWLSPRKPCELRIDSIPRKHLLAVCTKNVSLSLRDWWEDITIVFTAYDPFFVSDVEKAAPVNTRFIVGGTEPAAWRIEQHGQSTLTTPRWTHSYPQATPSPYLELSGNIAPSGLVINSGRRTIRNNLQSLTPALTLGSTWFDIQPGRNQITASGGAGGTIVWWERTI